MTETNDVTTMRDAALELARRGFAVFPIVQGTKQPRYHAALGFVHGVKDATRDLERIAAAWTRYPADNIGIACGAASGNLIVIDVDNHNAEHNGFDTLTAWEYDNGHMPETAAAKTGSVIEGKPKSGGLHLFYRTETEIATVHACGVCGIDIQAAGCYVVAPPSIHPTGNPYVWIMPPDIIAVAPADEHVMRFIEYVRQLARPTEPAERRQGALRVIPGSGYRQSYADAYIEPTHIPQGNRNHAVFQYAAHLWAQGYTVEDVASMTDDLNMRACDPPLSTNEVAGIVRSVIERYPQGHSAAWDAAHPAPQRRTPARPNIAAKVARRVERQESERR